MIAIECPFYFERIHWKANINSKILFRGLIFVTNAMSVKSVSLFSSAQIFEEIKFDLIQLVRNYNNAPRRNIFPVKIR